MNYLICSAGRRCNLVKWFTDEVDGKVYATDRDRYSPALYFADDDFLLDDRDYDNYRDYIYALIRECKRRDIGVIISLHDEQVLNFSKHTRIFEYNNITPIVSDYEIVEMCQDKSRYCELPINQIPIFIVKEKNGSASKNLIRQEYVEGTEYNIQCYFDIHSKKLLTVFMQEKLSMRAGETDKSISIWDDEIYNEIKKLDGLFIGVIDIDVIKGDRPYIIDINPRFGGGYPLAHACGMNYVKNIVKEINGIKKYSIKNPAYQLGVRMMKYNGLYFEE